MTRTVFAVFCVLLVWCAAETRAHATQADHASPGADAPRGAPRNWGELAGAWEFDALAVVPLALAGGLYARGLWRLWRQAGRGDGGGGLGGGRFFAGRVWPGVGP